jgi:hypothetical protein
MLIQEDHVLQPRKASLRNTDDWPTFNLERITVWSQKTGKKTSLLSAHPGNPVRVTGTLEAIDDDLLHLGTPTQFATTGFRLTLCYSTRQEISRRTHRAHQRHNVRFRRV